MRLMLFGSGAFGLPTFQHLARRHTIVAVVSQPDRPAGRGKTLTPTPVAAWAASELPHVALFKPAKVNDATVVEQLRELSAPHGGGGGGAAGAGVGGAGIDAWVVIAFGQKLSARLLDGVFAINLHASLLPRWRGAAPINAAILGGDSVTGNTVITLADRMDAGLILGRSTRAIDPLVTAGELHDLLAADGPELVEDVLAAHSAGTLKGTQQDESEVTIATKLAKSDDAIDFHQRADGLRRVVHALTPWPGITVVASAGAATAPEFKLLRVQAEPVKAEQRRAEDAPVLTEQIGRLLDPDRGLIACGHGTMLRLLEVQPAGKRAMRWDDFRRGAGRGLTSDTLLRSPRDVG